jgi:hypothetical protein
LTSAALALLLEPVLLPFALAALAAYAGRFWLGPRYAVPSAALAQVLGFLMAYLVLVGAPPWPPVIAREKIAFIAAGGVLLGLLLLMLPRWADALQALTLAWPVGIVLWLAWPMALGPATVIAGALLALLGAAVVGPLAGARQRNPRRLLMLLSALLGLAGIALAGDALALAGLALAVAASLGGVLLATRSLALANAALIGPSGSALALAATLVLYDGASRVALSILALVFAADRLARRLRSRRRFWLERLRFAACCLIPLALALAVARFGLGGLLP